MRYCNASLAPLRAGGAAVLLESIVAIAPEARAQSRIACGTVYRVVSGDTLEQIATRAYGTRVYWEISDANRSVLPDVWQIEAGTDLFIPCPDGAGPKTRREALAMGIKPSEQALVEGATATVAAVRPDDGGIGFLTCSDFAPFAHEALPEGGMIAELVRLAVASAAPERTVDISFVNDWPSHLGLLDQGVYDLGFPWYRPDCARADRLTASMRARCAQLDFSQPLFEVAIGYYARAGEPLADAAQYRQLFDRRICRPAGYFTFDLDQEDLRELNVSRVIAPTAGDCFAWLMWGEIDVVTLNEAIARSEITRLGLVGRVAENPALRSSQTLHVVAKKGDGQGRAYLDLVNAGVGELKASVRWFEVVSRHLGAFGVSL